MLNFLIQVSATALAYTAIYPWPTAVAAVWFLAAIVPGISLFIRRVRDAGYSPWMSLFLLAGPIGAVVFLVLLCQPSTVTATTPDILASLLRVVDAAGARTGSYLRSSIW